MNAERPRRLVQVALPEDVVVDIIEVLRASTASVREQAIAPLDRALREARQPRVHLVTAPKRLAVFHAFCELSVDAQAAVAEVIFWLHQQRPRSRRQLKASLDALARRHRG